MDKATTLFRVFDIAFFVPGSVLFVALSKAKYFSDIAPTSPLNTGGGVLTILVSVAGAYGLGLICHAISRGVGEFLDWVKGSNQEVSWYRRESGDRSYELATYFWYVRATCWNLCTALLLSLIVVYFGSPSEFCKGVLLFVCAVILFGLGFDYNRALDRATQKPHSDPDTGVQGQGSSGPATQPPAGAVAQIQGVPDSQTN